ncbi:MAG: hypothetical protein OHK0013_15160 [Sandaracinaceae bacterium]
MLRRVAEPSDDDLLERIRARWAVVADQDYSVRVEDDELRVYGASVRRAPAEFERALYCAGQDVAALLRMVDAARGLGG